MKPKYWIPLACLFFAAGVAGITNGQLFQTDRSQATPGAQAVTGEWMTEAQFVAWVDSLPAGGSVDVTKPIKIRSMRRREYDFHNVQLIWKGPADQSMFVLSSCDMLVFKWLRVWADHPGVSVFDVTRSPNDPGGFTPTACRWENVEIECAATGFKYGYRVDHRIGGGPDANLDNMQWSNCWVHGVSESMWYFWGTQSMLHSLYRSGGWGQGRTKNCIQSVHTYTIRVVGGGGSSLTGYAYQFGQLGAGFGCIDGAVWEVCKGGLFSLPGKNVTPIPLTIRNCRYNQLGPVLDTAGKPLATIAFGSQMPAVTIEQNEFESDQDTAGKWSPCSIRVQCAPWENTNMRKGGSAIVRQNCFMHNVTPKASSPVPEIQIGQTVEELQASGNQFWSGQQFQGPVKVIRLP